MNNLKDFIYAVPIAILCVVAFFLLQKTGIITMVTADNITYGTAFLIGIIASLSTCMAVVGGLVLSVSANFAQGGDAVRPQILFHVGRIASFFILGGIIGAIGSVFQFGFLGSFILQLFIAGVLIILGINLLGVMPQIKKIQITLPSFLRERIVALKHINHTGTPIILGIATFFLPCGFTQSMQMYTLTTGNFWDGGITMLSFALGTLPVLAILSFGSLGFHQKDRLSIFFKTAGIIVILFGISNVIQALAAYGIIDPFITT